MNKTLTTILTMALLAPSGVWAGRASRETDVASIVGAWTLNKDLSGVTADRLQEDDQRGSSGRRGRGGYGRGGSRGGFSGGRGDNGSPELQRRRTEAVRAMTEAPEYLTIVRTESLVIITTGDGRTTRLSPDGQKIKDQSTGIERKTKWDGNKLFTDITGAGPGKITETYEVDQENGRLNVTLHMENSRGPNAGVMHRVYDRLKQ